jgi:hypothetical protein
VDERNNLVSHSVASAFNKEWAGVTETMEPRVSAITKDSDW